MTNTPVNAFEAQALDYVLKPVQPERLRRTVARLCQALPSTPSLEATDRTLGRWRALLAAGRDAPSAPLRYITASHGGGATVRLVPIEDVLYFEAADKYVRVLTADSEYLIRTPLRQLLSQLDPQLFWQIHRACVVRASAIEAVHREDSGRLRLRLRDRSEQLTVSRIFANLFRAM